MSLLGLKCSLMRALNLPMCNLALVSFCQSEVHASLSQPDRDSCEGNISLDELSKSLRIMSTGKAPGPGGLSVEFFVKF